MNEVIISIQVVVEGIRVDGVTWGKPTRKEKLNVRRTQTRSQNTKMGKSEVIWVWFSRQALAQLE